MMKTTLTLLVGAVLGAAIMFYVTRPNFDYDECHRYHDSYQIRFAEAMAGTEDLDAVIAEYEADMPKGCEDYIE